MVKAIKLIRETHSHGPMVWSAFFAGLDPWSHPFARADLKPNNLCLRLEFRIDNL
jgi:hypothetical protein